MYKYLFVIFLSLFSLNAIGKTHSQSIVLSDSANVYILTCTPGSEVWSKYGHTGIRIFDQSQNIDIVFNYGIFSLMEKGFYLKFIQGETYYQLGIESYAHFEDFYSRIGRKTYLQQLNLNQEQKQRVFDALLINYQPNNRYYLYNFVFDNCATRPYYLLKGALQDSIISNYKGYMGQSFRSTISHYTGPYSWVDFGINLVFGNKADQLMTNEQRLFLPEELMFYLSEAYLSDGTPLITHQEIQKFPVEFVPWYTDSRLGIILFALLMVGISLWDRHRKRLSWWIDAILCLVYLILLTIVIFLTFFSVHPLVGFNWRLIIFPSIHLCARLIYWLR